MNKNRQANSSKDFGNATGSSISKYQQLIIGNTNLWFLIKYELIILFSSWLPGALGLFIRKFLYPSILGSVGKNVVFGSNITLRHPQKIHIGDNVLIDENCLLDAKGTDNSGIKIADGVFLGRNSILSCKNGNITLGECVNIGFNCEVYSGSNVEIQDNTILAAYCYLVGGDGYDLAITETPIAFQPIAIEGKELIVEPDCWLGAHCVVLNGVTMEKGSVLAAGSVLNQSTSAYHIYGGAPAKTIKRRPQ